ncbi:MAG TPA: Asp23/Gls24 family envelope stress response protein [Candidatus Limnocylindrales bacterium]|nr:Asp23/Gls24 family envelope stress response protein [Candidatus Limnocylindrales bacterium]
MEKTKATPRRMGKPKTLIQSRDLGRIEVSRRVVATIAGHAAVSCYGVVGMAAQGLRDGLAERLHRDNIHRGVEVEVREDGVAIALYVIVEFGTRVSEVANNLTNAVRYAVERTLGLAVVEVNINVQGIHVSGGA